MEYLDKFYDEIIKFLTDLNIRDVMFDINITSEDIIFHINSLSDNKNIRDNLSFLENKLKSFDKSIILTVVSAATHATKFIIKYKSNKNFTDRELKEVELYDVVTSKIDDFDIERLFSIEGALKDFKPFNLAVETYDEVGETSFIYDTFDGFRQYQRLVIKSLTEYQLKYYLKLRDQIYIKRRISNQTNLVIFDSDGFCFYEGENGKVKTLMFNER